MTLEGILETLRAMTSSSAAFVDKDSDKDVVFELASFDIMYQQEAQMILDGIEAEERILSLARIFSNALCT